ncbi:MAG TPA: DNA polymerase IV [Pseudonocardia sp.]|nr:DNA polymerase IV [Pseudonocardia sp.]
MGSGRWVLHLDMDAFYAAVEQLTRPTLRDRPVLVGGLGPRGVVAGASYQARVFGARSAMPMGQARRLCPHAVVLPPRGALYSAVSEQVMAVLAEAAPVVEPVSLDEAFLEPPALAGATPADVEEFGTTLRAAVRARTGLPASVGAGSGKQLAKIASELAKPDGLRVVRPDEEHDVLAPLPVRALWGVGPVAEAALHRLGVRTVGALAALDLREATDVLGVAIGTELHRLARGIDERPVAPRGAAKQVSAETTFDADLTTMAAVHDAVTRITGGAHRRLVESGRAARTVTVKIRSADFSTHTRSETATLATTDLTTLTAVAQRLARIAVPEGGVRLIGVSLAGLGDEPPPGLFGDPEPADDVAGVARVDGARAVPRDGGAAGIADGTHAADGVRGADARHEADPTLDGGGVLPAAEPAPAVRNSPPPGAPPPEPARSWRAGDDVTHAEFGHGWVQGAGHGRVTVRFETRSTGPGRARTLAADDPALRPTGPLASLA